MKWGKNRNRGAVKEAPGPRERAEGEGVDRGGGCRLERRVTRGQQGWSRSDPTSAAISAGPDESGPLARPGGYSLGPRECQMWAARARGPTHGRGSPKYAVESPTPSPRIGGDSCKRTRLGTPRIGHPLPPSLHPLPRVEDAGRGSRRASPSIPDGDARGRARVAAPRGAASENQRPGLQGPRCRVQGADGPPAAGCGGSEGRWLGWLLPCKEMLRTLAERWHAK